MRGSLSAIDIPINEITIDRLESILNDSVMKEGCLYLDKSPHHTGYTYTVFKGRAYGAHRLLKTISMGKNFPGKVTDHICDNKSCVRISHLEVVSQSENIKRGTAYHHLIQKSKNRTKCNRGHSYSYFYKTGRQCKLCQYISRRNKKSK